MRQKGIAITHLTLMLRLLQQITKKVYMHAFLDLKIVGYHRLIIIIVNNSSFYLG